MPSRDELEQEISEHTSQLRQVSDNTLVWLWSQIYDPADRGLRDAILQIVWDRKGKQLDDWPSYLTSEATNEWLALRGLPANHLVLFCADGDSPEDPKHQPIRELTFPPDSDGYIECSCGRRALRFELRVAQRRGSERMWPTEHIKGVSHFVVCRDAKHAQDRFHGLRSPTVKRCLCNRDLDESWLATPLPRLPEQ